MKAALILVLLLLSQATSAWANLYVTFDGDTTKIWDYGVRWSCGAQFFPVVQVSNDTIYVTERDTMRLVTCLCNYDVCTKLTGLLPGRYTAVVTRRHDLRMQDTVHSYEESAGSVTFTVLSPSSLSSQVGFFQSACSPDAVHPAYTVPTSYPVLSAYPNPFNPSTRIRFGISETGYVSLDVFNMLGQHVAALLSEKKSAGVYELEFDSGNLPSGVYVCRLVSDGIVVSHKIVLER